MISSKVNQRNSMMMILSKLSLRWTFTFHWRFNIQIIIQLFLCLK